MRYYDVESFEYLDKRYKDVLQKYFPDNDKWGICVLFNEDKQPETIEVCKLHDATLNGATWEHYANIARYDDGTWEVNTQFNGKEENEMWVFGYWKRFANAVRVVACGDFEKMKPLKIY